jgi:hypothetical protein
MRIESILTVGTASGPRSNRMEPNFDGWCESWNVQATDIRASKSIEERKAARRPRKPETGPLMKRNASRGH